MSSEGSSFKSEGQNADNICKIVKSGANDEYIHLGGKKYHQEDLMQAFGGTLNPGLSPWPKHEFANPAPLGLAAFAFTTFILSLYNAKAMGITVPNVVVSAACFYGGAVQFLAGVWELAIGNTFGGTALSSYGAFWLLFGVIFIKSFGIQKAYADEPEMFENALGFYLLGWAIVTFIFVLTTMKSTILFFSLFFFLFLTFLLLAGGALSGNANVSRGGGVVGVITSILGWYNAFAGASNKTNSYITVRGIPMPRAS